MSDADAPQPQTAAAPQPDTVADDPTLAGLRAELERVDELPLDQRVALFERTNDVITSVLAELDEV